MNTETDSLLKCSVCHGLLHDTDIWSSVRCGCVFHYYCFMELDETTARLAYYTAACPKCKWTGQTETAVSVDQPNLIVRNVPLQRAFRSLQFSHQKRLEEMQAQRTIAQLTKRDAVVIADEGPPLSQPTLKPTKRQKVSGPAGKKRSSIPAPSIDEEDDHVAFVAQRPELPKVKEPHPMATVPDSDPEDEDNVLHQLYTASQALAALPYTEQAVNVAVDASDVDGEDNGEGRLDHEIDQMEYIDRRTGMPPASQFKRASVRT